MTPLSLLIFIFSNLIFNVGCQEILKARQIDPRHNAEVDLDTQAVPRLGQADLPERWQRELFALTALSRLEAAKILLIETGHEDTTWLLFRGNALYEALLNMARITDFQMYNRSFPYAWSMWGLQESVAEFRRQEWAKEGDRYLMFRKAARGYPFDPTNSSVLSQAPMAFLMAAKWHTDLNATGTAKYLSQPFYGVKDIVDAYITLRDPTSYWLGDQANGRRLLRRKVVGADPPVCSREARIAIAFDTVEYEKKAFPALNKILGEIRQFTPHAHITIRGTSNSTRGFKEGATLDRYPDIGVNEVEDSEPLDHIDDSIKDIIKSENGDTLRAKAVIIISTFETSDDNHARARSLWLKAQASSIELYFVTLENYDPVVHEEPNLVDFVLLSLLNSESSRGIHSAYYDNDTARLIVHRMLRLICQSVVTIPYGEYKKINTFEKTANNIFDRVHLRIAPPKWDMFSPSSYDVSFRCLSSKCDFDVYGHLQRHVNEYFHDTHLKATLSSNEVIKGNFFSNSWSAIEESARVLDGPEMVANLVLVPSGAFTISVRAGVDEIDLTDVLQFQ